MNNGSNSSLVDDLIGIIIIHFIGLELIKGIMQTNRRHHQTQPIGNNAPATPVKGVPLTPPPTISSPKTKRRRQQQQQPSNCCSIEMSKPTIAVLQQRSQLLAPPPKTLADHMTVKARAPTTAILNRRTIGANWQQVVRAPTAPHRLPTNQHGVRLTKHIAMDCEMVGIGYLGKKHMLARVSIVNQMGDVLLDKFCAPWQPVIDYRTEISGIRPENLVNGEKFEIIQKEVMALLHNRILVGHAVYNDLKVLVLVHPPHMIRDTSKYRPLVNRVTGGSTPSLRVLALCVLNKRIQEGEHSSVEDARIAMQIFNRYQEDWERHARRKNC